MQGNSRRVIGRLVVAGAAFAVLGGCASIKDHRGYLIDQALIDSVQPGVDNKLSVERTLGRPTFASQFGDPAWYYVSVDTSQAAFTRPRTKDQMILRITFDPAGNVRTLERRGIERVVRLDPDGHQTPTLGRDRSFLEDLFGNIGAVGAAGMNGQRPGDNTGGGPNGS